MNDGFQWLDGLEPSLRDRLWELTSWVADGEHHRVVAAVPSLVEEARSQHMPWVEVYARNMRLRSVVLHQQDTRVGLPEAVDLTERASREDMRDCPQSICVAHALCSAYGMRDGVGHAAIRQQVAAETLERIDPRKVCFLCISNETADALIDAGEPESALDFLKVQTQRRLQAGAPVDPDDFGFREVHALLVMGRTDDALVRLEAGFHPGRGESWLRTWRQWKARLLAEQGSPEATGFLSSIEEIRADGGLQLHFDTLDALDRHGLLEADEGIRQRTLLGILAVGRGVARPAMGALSAAAETLIGQGERSLALATITRARGALADLVDPEPPRARLDALEARATALHSPPEGTFEHALQAGPAASEIGALSNVWRRFGFVAEANQLVFDRADAEPDDEALFRVAADVLLHMNDLDALELRLARPCDTEDGEAIALHYRARLTQRTDRAAAVDRFQELLALRPAWLGVADELGMLCFSLDRHEDALAAWTHGAEAMDRPNGFDWDVIAAATMLGRWDLVRASAILLGFPLEPGDEPIEGDFGVVTLRFDDDPKPFSAQRIAPLSARVHSLRQPGTPQRRGQVVLFHPQVLNTAEREASEEWIPPVHRAICVIGPPGERVECVAIDGLHPGDEVLAGFFDAAEAAGLYALLGSGDDYALESPDDQTSHPAVYLVVAVKPSEVDVLLGLAEGLPGLFAFPGLLRLAGREEEAARHDAVAEAWGM